MRAAIYLRVSTEDQARHGYSLAEQRQACRQRALSLGEGEVLEFADEGVSGALLDRPALNALREAVGKGLVDVIIVRDPDRLSRKLAHQLLLTEEFEKAGVKIEFLDFTWQDTPEGRMFYAIRGAIAEFEKEKIKERMTRGKLQKARQGGIPSGFNTYGYRYEKKEGKIIPWEEEAAVVRDIFQWFIEEDIGINGVAKRLNAMGIPTRKRKNPWHRMVVRQILINPVYKGTWKYKGIDINVPAIIEPETWERAQEKIKNARRLWAGNSRQDYLLSGLLNCGECGNSMTGIYINWWGRKRRCYTCTKNYQGAKERGCYPAKIICAQIIEDAVWEQVRSMISDVEKLVKACLKESNQDAIINELTRINKYIKHLEKGREYIMEALATGLVDYDIITRRKMEDIKRRKEILEKEKKELLIKLRKAEEINNCNMYVLAREVIAGLNLLDMTEKKEIIRMLVKKVVVSQIYGVKSCLTVAIEAKIPEPEIIKRDRI